jgi:hypothetical protein
MSWTPEQQQRLDLLRRQELTSPLDDAEQAELATLLSALEADEARYLEPALARMRQDATRAESALAATHAQNEALATLAQQQAQLLADARAWLATFDARRVTLQKRYASLTTTPRE